MKNPVSVINLKIKELEDFKKSKFKAGSTTTTKRIINGKINVLKEILAVLK
jgi:hypothetical protein